MDFGKAKNIVSRTQINKLREDYIKSLESTLASSSYKLTADDLSRLTVKQKLTNLMEIDFVKYGGKLEFVFE